MSQLRAGVGASDTLFQHERPNKPNRSKFDLSRITNFTCDPGMIVPFDWIFCLPGDDVNIDFEMILDTLPLINPSLTSYKVVTHWYKIDCKHLWAGWQTFITKGRSGNESLTIPKVNTSFPLPEIPNFDFGHSNVGTAQVFALGQHSLCSFLGNPSEMSGVYNFDLNDNPYLVQNYLPYTIRPKAGGGVSTGNISKYQAAYNTGFKRLVSVNALPFMAYQNIVKYNYVNSNLLQDNHSLFPVQGDHDWFLKFNASETNFLDYSSNSEVTGNEVYSYDGVYSSNDTVTRLDQLRYAMFDDDYFTTGLPWLQRGDTTYMDMSLNLLDKKLSDVFDTSTLSQLIDVGIFSNYAPQQSYSVPANSSLTDYSKINLANGDGNVLRLGLKDSQGAMPESPAIINFKLATFINSLKNLQAQSIAGKSSITANQLRELIAMSVWQERNARVDGSYNSMIYEHWMSNPHAEEHKPQYIGGTVDYVNFTTILQSSASTSDSPLGSTAGRGSTGGSGHVGRVHCNDYAYIMGIMIVKPNTTYMQGVEHHLCCENVMEDFPQPEFEGLSPQAILNKELYVSGDSNDNNLLCYQERYVYLKVRQNQNRGLFQCKPDKDRLFGSFTQARWFESRPQFSYQFLCMSPQNIRRDWLAYPSQPSFKLQTASKITVVRNLSYASCPNTFGF